MLPVLGIIDTIPESVFYKIHAEEKKPQTSIRFAKGKYAQ